jgi:acyl-coenzyme A thioesterase PaaI-like protein
LINGANSIYGEDLLYQCIYLSDYLMEKQPNSQHCFVCGISNPFGLKMKFYETAPGEVLAELTVPDQYQGYPGVVHGGIVAAMLDEAAGRTQMKGSPPRFMYTARLDICYRQNVPVGQPIKLTGKAGEDRRRTARATSQIRDAAGNLLAEADFLLVNLPDEKISTVDLETLGWKVYPDDG